MDPIKRPTKLQSKPHSVRTMARSTTRRRKDVLPEHQKVFDEIVMESEDLQGVTIGISRINLGSFGRRAYGEPPEKSSPGEL